MTRYLAVAISAFLLPAVAWAEAITIRMQDGDYAPNKIEARIGDTLVFVNDDVMDHEVFVPTEEHGVDLGKQAPAATTELPLGKAGSFDVECVFHPHMLLQVQVRP